MKCELCGQKLPDKPRRTDKQNRALHAYFTLLADELNDAGFDLKKTIRGNIDIPWTPEMIKNLIWRPVQKNHLGKESTTKLSTGDVDKIYNIINRELGTRLGLYVPFPSLDN